MSTKLKIDVQSLDIEWTPSTNYYLTIEEGFVQSVGGSGLINPTQILNFTTPATPVISETVPGNAATNISATTVKLIFDRESIFKKTGNIYLYKDASPSDILVSTISMDDDKVTVNNNEISINLLGIIDSFTTYYILLDDGIINDIFNFDNASVINENTFRFTTSGLALTATSPSNNATNVAPNSLSLTFNNDIVRNTGNIYIYEQINEEGDGVLVSTISVTDSKVTVSPANRLNIDVTGLLDFSKSYFVFTDANIVETELNQYKFAGIAVSNTFRFTTEPFTNNASANLVYNTNIPVIFNSAPTIRDNFNSPSQYIVQATASDANALGTISTYDNISSATLTNTLDLRSQEQNLRGIFIKPDGTKLWTIGTAQDRIQEYTLLTPWDLSTASLDSVTLSVSAQDNDPTHLFFSDDGTKLYVVGDQNNRIYQYDLGNAWTLETAVYNTKFFSTATQTTAPGGIYFKPDGTVFWIIATSINGRIFEYSLSTAWDITTASFTGKSEEFIGGSSIWFKEDGSSLFFVDGSGLIEMPLAFPWDISSRMIPGGQLGSGRLVVANSTDAIVFPSVGKVYVTQVISNGLNSILEYTTVTETFVSKTLTLIGSKTTINAALTKLRFQPATSFASNFNLTYNFFKNLFVDNKTQPVTHSSTPVTGIVGNLDIVRTYSANQINNNFLGSGINPIAITEFDSTNPDYTVSLTSSIGQFGSGVPTLQSQLSSTISFTGKKTDVNAWLGTGTTTQRRSWSFLPNNGLSGNSVISFSLQKNGVDYLLQDIPVVGTARTNADIIENITANTTFTPFLWQQLYYNMDVVLVGGGGGGAKGGGGGGGQVLEQLNLAVNATAYTATIGTGGAGALATAVLTSSSGTAGTATTLVSGAINLSAGGGAGGIGVYTTSGNASGGSAGGSGPAGGSVIWNVYSSGMLGAGGGGSGEVGGSGLGEISFNGGAGLSNTINNVIYGGGGGGGAGASNVFGTRLGGAGGGGGGAGAGLNATAGTANTGGGGGGAAPGGSNAGGAGGSGRIVIRYKQKP